jgi:hypothetical protein
MANNPKIEVEIGAKINNLKNKLKETDRELKKTGKSFDKLNSFATGALQGIAAAFTVGAVVNFGKAVLDTTAKFQKFEAVLTNTLGSSSEAQLALIQIQDFASKTPFAVDELTSSFVKLANQGFKPTLAELRSLGDLASSTGKGFDQLAEAIIDAQVGEFERLKEFGIRAKKEGDNVTFTFKGVETQVKATDTAIRGYVLSLGDAEGVSGAMAAISATLGGKISNLGDNIEQLKLAIGSKTSGVFATSLDWLNEFIGLATLAAKGVAQIRDEASQSKIGAVISANRKQVEELAESYAKINPAATQQANLAKAIADVSRGFREAQTNTKAFIDQNYTKAELEQIVEGFNSLSIELLNISSNTDVAKISLEEFSKIADKLNKQVFQKFAEDANLFNKELTETLRIQSQIASISESIAPTLGRPSIVDNGIDLGGTAPIQEFADVADPILESVRLKVEDLAGAFTGLGAVIGKAFNNPQLGTFVGQFAQFVTKIIAGAFAVSKANAVAGATQSSLFTGPAAAFTLPAFIAGAVGLVASAFSGIGGGGRGSAGGAGTSGISQGTSFTGQGGGSTGFNRELNLRGEFRIDGTDLVYVVDQARASQI